MWLRVIAGGVAMVQASQHLASGAGAASTPWLLAAVAVLSGGSLLAGFLTPAVAAGVGVSTLAIAAFTTPPPGADLAAHWQGSLFVAADALALAMLGPGALSIDAWLFGRREIVIGNGPDRRPPP